MTPTRVEAAPSAVSPGDDLSEKMDKQKMVEQEMVEQNAPKRSLLAKLLHALNQPLTGLQCSMEVALARPRTLEQYVQGLHDGLELTERMRALVGAIREVAEIEEAQSPQLTTSELTTLELESSLREAADELRPVAEEQNVRITLGLPSASSSLPSSSSSLPSSSSSLPSSSSSLPSSSSSSLAMRGERSELGRVIFRLLDSTLSIAASGTALRIEVSSGKNEVWLRMNWRAEAPAFAYSRPALGLMIVQAWLEKAGAEWRREETDGVETLTVRLPRGRSA
jgi:signal transduction histidine kinase